MAALQRLIAAAVVMKMLSTMTMELSKWFEITEAFRHRFCRKKYVKDVPIAILTSFDILYL